MAVIVTIGGERHVLPPLTFARLKAAWPLIERGREPLDRLQRTDLSLSIIAPMLGTDADALAEMLLATEMEGVIAAIPAILAEGGLIVLEGNPSGEAEAGSMPAASTT